jgi:hypothetical protein
MSAAKGVSEGGYLWGCDENGKHLGFKTLVLQVRPLPASPLNASLYGSLMCFLPSIGTF